MSHYVEPGTGAENASVSPNSTASRKFEPLKISDALIEHIRLRRPDIYWGARGDSFSKAAAAAACDAERRELHDKAADAYRLSRDATAMMERLGVSEMPDGAWSVQG